jgi:hypothetical protein
MSEMDRRFREVEERVKRVEERSTSTALRVQRDPNVIASNLLGYLAFLREIYGGAGSAYQERLANLLIDLRIMASAELESSFGYSRGKFFTGFADLIEECGRSGAWPGLAKR